MLRATPLCPHLRARFSAAAAAVSVEVGYSRGSHCRTYATSGGTRLNTIDGSR